MLHTMASPKQRTDFFTAMGFEPGHVHICHLVDMEQGLRCTDIIAAIGQQLTLVGNKECNDQAYNISFSFKAERVGLLPESYREVSSCRKWLPAPSPQQWFDAPIVENDFVGSLRIEGELVALSHSSTTQPKPLDKPRKMRLFLAVLTNESSASKWRGMSYRAYLQLASGYPTGLFEKHITIAPMDL